MAPVIVAAMAAEGYTGQEVADEFGIHLRTLRQIAADRGIRFPRKGPDADLVRAEIMRLLSVNDGMSGRSIARLVKRSWVLVARWLRVWETEGLVMRTGASNQTRWFVTEKWTHGDD